jgi:soluble lytic murein transglycosylase-like protein
MAGRKQVVDDGGAGLGRERLIVRDDNLRPRHGSGPLRPVKLWLCMLLLVIAPAFAEEALLALEERIRSGDADAAIALARRLEFGMGVEADLARAAELYCDAAMRGRAEAALRLAGMFLDGEGVEVDVVTSAAWLAIGQQVRRPVARPGQPCAAGPALSATATTARGESTMPTADLAKLVRAVALRQSVDPALIMAMVAVESAFRPEAVSPRGARGLLQVMPATATSLGISDPHDPLQNLVGAIGHIRRLLGRYDGNVSLALAAYNAGEGAVTQHRGIPPFAETQAYVQRVLALRSRMVP